MCSVRFFSRSSLVHARCDCKQGNGCAHVVLAVWAFREAGTLHTSDADAERMVALSPRGAEGDAADAGVATQWLTREAAQAARAVEQVMSAQEFRAGLKLLVLALCGARVWTRAAAALERFFTRYGFDPDLRGAADLVCQRTGRPGWCALAPDGVLHWGSLPAGDMPDMALDGQPRALLPGGSTALPPYWRHVREIRVRHAGTLLLGGRPDPGALGATLGAMWPDDHGLAGWGFMPGPIIAPNCS